MADAAYNEYRNALLGNWTHSAVDLDTDTIRIMLIDEGTDVPDLVNDVDYADRVAGAIEAEYTITTPTVGSVGVGVFDHEDATFTSVTGDSVESYDYFKWSGSGATSPLLVNIDSATGLPVTPNGGDITITVAAGGAWTV